VGIAYDSYSYAAKLRWVYDCKYMYFHLMLIRQEQESTCVNCGVPQILVELHLESVFRFGIGRYFLSI
jgi:hypothetical protein